jgi:hypothetical protein
MRKLGKPGVGYSASRKITAKESELTGLKKSVIIYYEHDGIISFWTRNKAEGGLDNYVSSAKRRHALEEILDKFWSGMT